MTRKKDNVLQLDTKKNKSERFDLTVGLDPDSRSFIFRISEAKNDKIIAEAKLVLEDAIEVSQIINEEIFYALNHENVYLSKCLEKFSDDTKDN